MEKRRLAEESGKKILSFHFFHISGLCTILALCVYGGNSVGAKGVEYDFTHDKVGRKTFSSYSSNLHRSLIEFMTPFRRHSQKYWLPASNTFCHEFWIFFLHFSLIYDIHRKMPYPRCHRTQTVSKTNATLSLCIIEGVKTGRKWSQVKHGSKTRHSRIKIFQKQCKTAEKWKKIGDNVIKLFLSFYSKFCRVKIKYIGLCWNSSTTNRHWKYSDTSGYDCFFTWIFHIYETDYSEFVGLIIRRNIFNIQMNWTCENSTWYCSNNNKPFAHSTKNSWYECHSGGIPIYAWKPTVLRALKPDAASEVCRNEMSWHTGLSGRFHLRLSIKPGSTQRTLKRWK